jgi:hypothetical protein
LQYFVFNQACIAELSTAIAAFVMIGYVNNVILFAMHIHLMAFAQRVALVFALQKNGPPSNPNSIAITNAIDGLGTKYVIIPHPNSPQAINNGSSPNQNYKTELCKNYTESGGCPYGWRCKFAHGKDELARFGNAYQMHANGLIENPHTYLSLPCFNHVATGSW